MFRSAVVRATRLARHAPAPAVARPVAPRWSAPRSIAPAKPAVAVGLRSYSAPASLTKEEVEGRIKDVLKGFDKVTDESAITGTSNFSKDLGLDSLDTVEVVMAIEEEFSIEIPDKDADNIHSIDQAVNYILSQPDAH